jgi:transposase-like protein
MTAERREVFGPETKAAIVEALAGESMQRLCQREGMPNRRTVERWMDEDAEFAAQCARAREAHAERIFDNMEDVEDGVLDGSIRPDAAKVVLSSRQWRAEKLKPRKFGAKTELTHELGPSVSKIIREIIDPMGH